ncbi:phosphopantetheine adenylyltransferase [Hydrogenispora ethanolica]|jgi:pantetheine-phosphate adenylyltransferase|uniref:Phosphopantetheine adenylyltransferase n=1 Tax=Hydrogenispora ethanolica TaxID=1082276 RepID=A0A4V2QEU3_HYDET|nr:phosphopantetheine adenylyltransferase [Hydrogenispora ethanolica]
MTINQNSVKAVCPGSFDPITYGHIDIIERAAQLFPSVIVGVLKNPNKKPLFTAEERVELIKSATRHLPNVEVLFFSGLLVDFVRAVQGNLIIKGLRAISDFEIEFQMSLNNKRMAPEIETMFMMTKNEYSFLSSSMVKEVVQFGGEIKDLVPPEVAAALVNKFSIT